MSRVLLGVNVDHVATLRQARGTRYPDPLLAALQAEQAGADGITVHLREDRRHIQERDVLLMKDSLQTRMNLELAVTEEMMSLATRIKPEHCCMVPEKREEITTEGGLDVLSQEDKVTRACDQLAAAGIEVSLFIDPEEEQIAAAKRCGAPVVELHTGQYAESNGGNVAHELAKVQHAVEFGRNQGLVINAGHGLHYHNVLPIAAIEGVHELNIGHSIVARALFVGFSQAVREMRELLDFGKQVASRDG